MNVCVYCVCFCEWVVDLLYILTKLRSPKPLILTAFLFVSRRLVSIQFLRTVRIVVMGKIIVVFR